MDIKDLYKDYLKWAKESVVDQRVKNGESGYGWLYKSLGYSDELTLEKFQKFFDRKDKNSEYKSNYKQGGIAGKKSYAWLQNEINMIYSFHKSFAMRNQTRLQLYRNDLSQKGARMSSAVNIGLGKFLHKKDEADKD
jgi:hypothetical protein